MTRLVDADALEKLFEEECAGECPICIYSHEGCPCGLIKTAPTVEITEEQAIDKLHETGWMQRHDKEMTERPTGKWLEWEDERWGGVWHYCSNCHNDALYKRVDGIFKQILSDYCPNCGAEMKQEEKDEQV